MSINSNAYVGFGWIVDLCDEDHDAIVENRYNEDFEEYIVKLNEYDTDKDASYFVGFYEEAPEEGKAIYLTDIMAAQQEIDFYEQLYSKIVGAYPEKEPDLILFVRVW